MTFSNLWARITGADKGKQFPNQQASSLGKIADYTIIFPYGFFADLPNDVLMKVVAPGVLIPAATKRPSDSSRGETVIFHPSTNSRIIMRNSGDIDIIAGSGDVNITAALTKVNGDIHVTGDLQLDGKASLGSGGPAIARVGDTVSGGVITSGSSNHTAD